MQILLIRVKIDRFLSYLVLGVFFKINDKTIVPCEKI